MRSPAPPAARRAETTEAPGEEGRAWWGVAAVTGREAANATPSASQGTKIRWSGAGLGMRNTPEVLAKEAV